MFAIVSLNGNQYKFIPGKEYKIDLKDPEQYKDQKLNFDQVLLISDDKIKVGTPAIKDAIVEAEIIQPNFKDEKVTVFKFHAKKRYKRTKGHRQEYSIVKILSIKS